VSVRHHRTSSAFGSHSNAKLAIEVPFPEGPVPKRPVPFPAGISRRWRCLASAQVERNGRHYFRGLGHLSEAEKADALAARPDLYERRAGEVFVRIADGMLACASLQVPGMGVAALPTWPR
jgi:hypothetical protein